MPPTHDTVSNDARGDDAPSPSPSPQHHVIFTDLDGTGGVLVDLDTKQYYQLNETASLVWRGLTDGKAVPEIVAQMTAIYEVTPARAQASTSACQGSRERERHARARAGEHRRRHRRFPGASPAQIADDARGAGRYCGGTVRPSMFT